jgi:hypothetical protein
MVLFVEAIPFMVLYGVLGCPLCRRSRFWLRVAGVVIAMLLPVLVAILAPVREQTALILLLVGFGWGILLALSSSSVLFHGRGFDAGGGDDDGGGPGPGDGRPTPPAPIGGIALPDKGPSSKRVRDHRPLGRALRPRRPTRQRERLPSRLWPLRLMAVLTAQLRT